MPIRHTQICFLQNSAEHNSTDKHMPCGLLAVKYQGFGHVSGKIILKKDNTSVTFLLVTLPLSSQVMATQWTRSAHFS